MGRMLIVATELRIKNLFEKKVKEKLPKYSSSFEGLVKFIDPFLKESFSIGIDFAREFRNNLGVSKGPKQVKFDKSKILATLSLRYQMAVEVRKVKLRYNAEIMKINGVKPGVSNDYKKVIIDGEFKKSIADAIQNSIENASNQAQLIVFESQNG